MRKLAFGVLALSLFALGCSQSGTTADNANKMADMEKRVNDQALKDKPLPPGDGPGN